MRDRGHQRWRHPSAGVSHTDANRHGGIQRKTTQDDTNTLQPDSDPESVVGFTGDSVQRVLLPINRVIRRRRYSEGMRF